jgi:LCP family protein required for cell wall assembly
MREKKGTNAARTSKGKKANVRSKVALYLRELVQLGMSDDEIAAELAHIVQKKGENRRHTQLTWLSDTTNKQKKANQMGHPMWLYFLLFILMIHLPALYGLASAMRWQALPSASTIRGTTGVLVVGLDNEGNDSLKNGRADSITYVGANWNAKKAVALPIYRDAYIMQTCTGTEDNINQIYRNHGITCFIDSVAQFLDLPIDYYAILTIRGASNIITSLGGVALTPTSSYCSDYGEDGKMHCFIAGQRQVMSGPQALAYIRYRGSHSGEKRANRQLELMYALKDHCAQNVLSCYFNIPPEFSQGVRTNMSLQEAEHLPALFSDAFHVQPLEVLAGRNNQTSEGWKQSVSAYDLITKTQIIREEIFVA